MGQRRGARRWLLMHTDLFLLGHKSLRFDGYDVMVIRAEDNG